MWGAWPNAKAGWRGWISCLMLPCPPPQLPGRCRPREEASHALLWEGGRRTPGLSEHRASFPKLGKHFLGWGKEVRCSDRIQEPPASFSLKTSLHCVPLCTIRKKALIVTLWTWHGSNQQISAVLWAEMYYADRTLPLAAAASSSARFIYNCNCNLLFVPTH